MAFSLTPSSFFHSPFTLKSFWLLRPVVYGANTYDTLGFQDSKYLVFMKLGIKLVISF